MNKVRTEKQIGIFFLTLILVFTFFGYEAFATELTGGSEPYITVSSYEVSDGMVEPGKEFELILKLQNSSELVAANNVLVNVTSDSGITTVYPTLPQYYIGSIEPNTTKNLTFTYKTPTSYTNDTISFYINIASDTKTNYVVATAPVNTDNSRFFVSSATVPDETYAGVDSTAIIAFRINNEDNLSNVVLNAYLDDIELPVSTAPIGNISAGASKSQSISMRFDEIGDHSVKLELVGVDSNGTEYKTVAYSGMVKVSPAEEVEGNSTDSQYTSGKTYTQRDKMVIAGSSVMILLCICGMIYIIRKYN